MSAEVWHVLHVKSRQEKVLGEEADRLGITNYVPLTQRVTYHGGRKSTSTIPLLPGYVFLFGTREQAFQIDRLGRVVKVIPVIDQTKLERELDSIRLALSNGAELLPHPMIRAGLHVAVRSGPFEGVEGVCESNRQHNRLILKVGILGQAVSMEIDGDLLDIIESPSMGH